MNRAELVINECVAVCAAERLCIASVNIKDTCVTPSAHKRPFREINVITLNSTSAELAYNTHTLAIISKYVRPQSSIMSTNVSVHVRIYLVGLHMYEAVRSSRTTPNLCERSLSTFLSLCGYSLRRFDPLKRCNLRRFGPVEPLRTLVKEVCENVVREGSMCLNLSN